MLVGASKIMSSRLEAALPVRRWTLHALVVMVTIAAPALAQDGSAESPQRPVVEEAPLELGEELVEVPEGTTIGEISVRTGDIFDTDRADEDHWLFRLANRLHPTTREWVIRDQLLFRSGDTYSEHLRAESERLLRSKKYIYDSWVRPSAVHDGVVDVDVVTRDVWTLNLGFHFGLAGGASTSALRLDDRSIFGTGKDVTIEQASNVDRTSTRLLYGDPNVLGSRVRFETLFEDNSDGSVQQLGLEKPFESLDSHWRLGLQTSKSDQIDPIYSLGKRIDQFRQQSTFVEVRGGLSQGLVEGRTLRWLAGVTYQQDLFDEAPETEPGFTLPPDRTLVYPWVGFGRIRESVATTRHLNRLDGTEDVLDGTVFSGRLGYASTALGSTENAAVFDASADRGWLMAGGRTLAVNSLLNGRWGRSGPENLSLTTAGRYSVPDLGRHQIFAAVRGVVSTELDAERQLLLGGDNGLRGYPLRYQSGSSLFLVTLEQRFFTDWQPLRLVNVGAAAFFDSGRAWGAGNVEVPNLGWLRDIGVGLRLGSNRSAHTILHFDVAVPLDRDPSIKSVQFIISAKDKL